MSNIDTTEHLRAAVEAMQAQMDIKPSRKITAALEAVRLAQRLWVEAMAPAPKPEPERVLRASGGIDPAKLVERRRFTAQRVTRADAGGTLWAPVDQFGVESGDTPSYGYMATQHRCDELNAR